MGVETRLRWPSGALPTRPPRLTAASDHPGLKGSGFISGVVAAVKISIDLWQCAAAWSGAPLAVPDYGPAPPQDAPGGPGWLDTPKGDGRVRPLGAQPRSRCLGRAGGPPIPPPIPPPLNHPGTVLEPMTCHINGPGVGNEVFEQIVIICWLQLLVWVTFLLLPYTTKRTEAGPVRPKVNGLRGAMSNLTTVVGTGKPSRHVGLPTDT